MTGRRAIIAAALAGGLVGSLATAALLGGEEEELPRSTESRSSEPTPGDSPDVPGGTAVEVPSSSPRTSFSRG